ncbi:MAG: hypothetical protein U5L09_20265 [Bacteroidales bacterium]|nr:hypothetical protein [Bacteroidales bacterium]
MQMKTKSITGIVWIILLLATNAFSQGDKISLNGYIKSMQTVYAPEENTLLQQDILSDNLIHNRLNFRYYATPELTVALEARNRFMYGEIVRLFPDYGDMLDEDPGFLDLSKTIASGDGYALHTMIDRFYMDYVKGDFQTRIGRQRINWGINMVWNPNDVFNTFNYFDFDYEERPGTDAVKLQYYTGVASSAQLVYRPADSMQATALAGMYKLNKWGYDFQFLGGYINEDLVAGGGWSGNIGNAGFRGEATYFRDNENFADTTGQLVASISADYMFRSSFYLHAGLLYNSKGTTGDASREGLLLQNQDLSVKTLTPAKTFAVCASQLPGYAFVERRCVHHRQSA